MAELAVSLFRGVRGLMPSQARSLINAAYNKVLWHLPLKTRIAIQYFRSFRKLPSFSNPKTFNEKCQQLKLSNDTRIPQCVDKITAKLIAAKAIGDEHIIPTLYSGDFLPPVGKRDWPVPYVIKANHGSGLNIFIRKETDKDWPVIEARLKTWLAYRFGHLGGELYYSEFRPQVLVEPFVAKNGELPLDYKIFVFGGVPKFIQVDTDREAAHKRILFDTQWQRQNFRFGFPLDNREIPKPDNLEMLLDCAGKLAEGFAFMRADFYVIDGKIFFGEMGFTPDSGFNKFYPDQMDRTFGDLWP